MDNKHICDIIERLPFIPVDIDKDSLDFIKSIEKTDKDFAVCVEDGKLNVLYSKSDGWGNYNFYHLKKDKYGNIEESNFSDKNMNDSSSFFGLLIPYFKRKYKECVRLRDEHLSKINRYAKINEAKIEEAIKDIQVYQLSKDEYEKEFGVKTELALKDKPSTFLCENNRRDLRIAAYLIGANAVVHYHRGSAMGTPIKIIDDDNA